MYAQLTLFDGPRSPELVAAAERAGTERIDPLLDSDPELRADLVARYVLTQPDGGSAVVVISRSEARDGKPAGHSAISGRRPWPWTRTIAK